MADGAPRVFLSYRREDARHVAGRLADHLRTRFQLFMDVETVRPGSDFTQAVGRAVGESDVLLAVIGQQWSTVLDDQGRRRLEDPADWVVFEISAALQRGITVIPVLVDGARMPTPAELPPPLFALASRQAVFVRHESFADDSARLEQVIRQVAGRVAPPQPTRPPTQSRSRVGVITALVVLVMLLGAGTAVAIKVLGNGSAGAPSNPSTTSGSKSAKAKTTRASSSPADTTSSEPSDTPTTEESSTPQENLSLGTSAAFEFYVVTATNAEQDPTQGLLVNAQVCAVKLTGSSTDGKSQISWEPWQVTTAAGHTYPGHLLDESTPPDSMFPKTGRYAVGECASGVIPFGDVTADDPVAKISYLNQFGNVAEWTP